ncbi:flagellar hook-associated protein FlgL [Colwellia echini]|uniref:Flagellar hook-associated protein 3 n=1 Tax=Colwellia echini TaxID=1982103 RepID=A0ABY3MWJ2_9GAMM|nr:flagellar hook-associated protein FlgL [Colwellia echini]TYK65583.1 flagellar hook-associated protein 3 [Colwellia echini]
MRVSTSQFYMQSALQMGNKSSELNEQMAKLSSGKQVLTAKDNAVQYSTLAGYKDDLSNIEKYNRNIIQAESNNNLQETMFSDAEDILNNVRDLVLQANNGAMSDEDLQAINDQLSNNLEQLVDIANSQDENGDYIFAGFQTSQQPFSQKADGSVNYSGDSGVNTLQVSKNINVATNQSGDAAFMKVANAIGDFSANYPPSLPAFPNANTSGVALASANITDRGTYNTSATPHDYTFDFAVGTGDLTVTDSAGGTTTFPVADYEGGKKITIDGIEVSISGNPLPGESFTMSEQEEVSIFDAVNNAISWVGQGVSASEPEQRQVDYNTVLDQLSSTLTHLSSRRSEVGIRLQVLENQDNRHLDTALGLESGKANIEDLDIAKAITEFEQSQLALQASQQVFTKVQGLTLFNYL